MAYASPFGTLKTKYPYGTSTTVGPGYTQAQVDASLAANPPTYAPNGGILFQPAAGMMGDTSAIGGTTGGGGGIDWASLIQNDPLFKQSQANLTAANARDLASRNALINRQLVQYGRIPDFAQAQQQLGFDLGSIVDPQTAQLAAQNQYSTTANLLHAYNLGVQRIRQQLAARGALQSGELGYQLGEANRSYGGAQYDAAQHLLDLLNADQGSYMNAQDARNATSTQAMVDALTRVLQQYGNSVSGGGPSNTPPPPTNTQTTAPSAGGTPQGPGISGTVAQNIQNYGIGQNPAQRVNFIGY